MKFVTNFILKTYLLCATIAAIRHFSALVSPEAAPGMYYRILIAFNLAYIITYGLSLACSLLTLISIIPQFLFIYKRSFLTPKIWQRILISRLIFDLVGHKYEWTLLRTMWLQVDVNVRIIGVTLLVLLILPSYLLHYLYAFHNEKLHPR